MTFKDEHPLGGLSSNERAFVPLVSHVQVLGKKNAELCIGALFPLSALY